MVSLPDVDLDLINTYVLIVFIFSFDIYETARITQLVKSAGCLNEGLDGHSQEFVGLWIVSHSGASVFQCIFIVSKLYL